MKPIDYDGYLDWVSAHPNLDRPEELVDQLEEYWDSLQTQAPEQTGPTMEMSM